jgi:hypothetical protein
MLHIDYRERAMNYPMRIAYQLLSFVQSLTPMQLLAAAMCTLLLGYLGIMRRLAKT